MGAPNTLDLIASMTYDNRLLVLPGGDGEGGGVGGRLMRWLFRKPLVVVVNALSECDRDSESAAVLELLGLGAAGEKPRLRVRLTKLAQVSHSLCHPGNPLIRRHSFCAPQNLTASCPPRHLPPIPVITLTGTEKHFLCNLDWPHNGAIGWPVEEVGSQSLYAPLPYENAG
jgi:hypothetical protein